MFILKGFITFVVSILIFILLTFKSKELNDVKNSLMFLIKKRKGEYEKNNILS